MADDRAGARETGATVEAMLVALVGILTVFPAVLVVAYALADVSRHHGLVDEDSLADAAVLAEHLLAGALVAHQPYAAGGPRVLGRTGAQLSSVNSLTEAAVLTAHAVTIDVVAESIFTLLPGEAFAASADATAVVAVAKAAVAAVDSLALVPLALPARVHAVRAYALRLPTYLILSTGAVVVALETDATTSPRRHHHRCLLFAASSQQAQWRTVTQRFTFF